MSIDQPPLRHLFRESQPPARSGDPERDWYLEARIDSSTRPGAGNVATNNDPSWDSRQLRRMSWRAEGAQDYPGGALDTLLEIANRRRRPAAVNPC